MNFQLVLDGSANEDLADAREWYEDQQVGLSDRFLSEVLETLDRIKENPFQFPFCFGSSQRANLSVFPYSIYFVTLSSGIIVVNTIHHQSQHPNHWQKPKE